MRWKARNLIAQVLPGVPGAEAPAGDAPPTTNGAAPAKQQSLPGSMHRNSSLRLIGPLLQSGVSRGSVSVLRTTINELNEANKYRYMLHPMSAWKTVWDLLSAGVVVYYSWIVPFMLCFSWYELPHRTKVTLRVLDVWGCLDVLLRFRTGIIEFGAVVMNPKRVRRAYVRSIWFPIDIVSSVPLELIFTNASNITTRKTIKMIKYVKLPRLLRIGRFVKYVKGYKRYSSLIIMLNALVFIAHVAGCAWVAILKPCEELVATDEPLCKDDGAMRMYWIAFHHGLVSLLGISVNHVESADEILSGGYHRQRPQDHLDESLYLWSSGVSILGALLTAAIYGTIISLVQSWNRAENKFRKKMDQITHEMEALALPRHIRVRCRPPIELVNGDGVAHFRCQWQARVTAYYDYLWLNVSTHIGAARLSRTDACGVCGS
ncbi:hypothetical protein PINS_up001990 [Pythium insidiosum]|nr:hypothetical protein PINS_up001990 [Pythium insidiosum]